MCEQIGVVEVNRSGLLKCPRSEARRVRRQSKIFLPVRTSERMCDLIGIIEVFQISSQESVEAVKDVWSDRGCWSAQDLRPGKCRGSHISSLRSEFPKGYVNRLALLKCPRSPARKVLRQSRILSKFLEGCVYTSGLLKCTRSQAWKVSRQSKLRFLGC